MSKFLSAVARTEFDTLVKHAYQGKSKLRNTVSVRDNVVGDTYKFRLFGKGFGRQRTGSSSLVIPMDITHSLPTATLGNWEHPEYTDMFDQATVNFDEQKNITDSIGKGMGRTEDQIIINTIVAGTYNTTPTVSQGFDIAAGGTGFTIAKLQSLREYFDNLEVDDTITIGVSGTGMQRLLVNAETRTIDSNSIKALVNGEINTYMGFKFVTIGSRRVEGGLGGSGLIAYAWAPNSVGLAVGNIEKSMSVDWIPERISWLCNGMLKAGATIIDPEGTARIAFT